MYILESMRYQIDDVIRLDALYVIWKHFDIYILNRENDDREA